MSDAGEGLSACRSCGGAFGEVGPDAYGSCASCRRAVVRRATLLAVFPALLVLGLYFWFLAAFGMFGSRFVIVWLALGAALAWVAFKIARRVLFDVVRARGVRAHSHR